MKSGAISYVVRRDKDGKLNEGRELSIFHFANAFFELTFLFPITFLLRMKPMLLIISLFLGTHVFRIRLLRKRKLSDLSRDLNILIT